MGASASRERFLASTDRLSTETVGSDDVEFWDELWKLGSSSEEVSVEFLSTANNLRRIFGRPFEASFEDIRDEFIHYMTVRPKTQSTPHAQHRCSLFYHQTPSVSYGVLISQIYPP
jgi:hypothetical protein